MRKWCWRLWFVDENDIDVDEDYDVVVIILLDVNYFNGFSG